MDGIKPVKVTELVETGLPVKFVHVHVPGIRYCTLYWVAPFGAVQDKVADVWVTPVTAPNSLTGDRATTGGAHVNVSPFEGTISAFPEPKNTDPVEALLVTALLQLQVVPEGILDAIKELTLDENVVGEPDKPICAV